MTGRDHRYGGKLPYVASLNSPASGQPCGTRNCANWCPALALCTQSRRGYMHACPFMSQMCFQTPLPAASRGGVSTSESPLARFIMATTSAFLLVARRQTWPRSSCWASPALHAWCSWLASHPSRASSASFPFRAARRPPALSPLTTNYLTVVTFNTPPAGRKQGDSAGIMLASQIP